MCIFVEKEKSYNTMIGDDTNYDSQPKSDNEDSQANNVVFHSQFELGKKTSTCVNFSCFNSEKMLNLTEMRMTMTSLRRNYIVIKTENVKLLEENSHINALCETLKLELQQTTTEFENTVEKLEEAEKYMEKLNKGKMNCGDFTCLGYVDSKIIKALVTHLSLKTSTSSDWYIDSGYLNHMTRNKDFLTDYQSQNGGTVSYSDGVKK
ncbi:hypothetical protein M9H77_24154 [Catharanthus roseus]|uniref:Uncharacterized protein n=1 Tax=Catharanthus roseus TaxID=4058 RepID=A0ACC0AZH2_CATRO|nr:hypothetical protein M9H77_24154 [Catharanthus roseus]